MTSLDLPGVCDRTLAKPRTSLLVLGSIVALQVLVSVDVANIAISYFTLGILLLMHGSDRRERRATQAKLDEIIRSIDNARDDLLHAEDEIEEKIEELRP